jgi:hypothetical protein
VVVAVLVVSLVMILLGPPILRSEPELSAHVSVALVHQLDRRGRLPPHDVSDGPGLRCLGDHGDDRIVLAIQILPRGRLKGRDRDLPRCHGAGDAPLANPAAAPG